MPKTELRGGAVNARRPGVRGRSEVESVDGAEHSAMIERVMATRHQPHTTRNDPSPTDRVLLDLHDS